MVVLFAGLAGLATSGCNSLNRKTRAFVATEACGQGPFEVVIPADATTGDEGVEVIACTPRRLAGYVELTAGDMPLWKGPFGDQPDNQRCLGGRPVGVVQAAAPATSPAAGQAGGRGATRATSANLSERPFTYSETPFSFEVCKPYGIPAQTVLTATTLTRTNDTLLARGDLLRVRIWSEVPNDLEGVVFLVRHVTSKRTVEEAARDQAEYMKRLEREEREGKRDITTPPPPRPPVPDAPPAPLAEERPPAPSASSTWIPGYWVRTGGQWGWVAGFWRDERHVMPPPQVEIPGAPPHPGAVWIGGTWTLRAGVRVWIRGRWR